MTLSADPYLTPADLDDFLPEVSESKRAGIILDVFAEMVDEAPSIDPAAGRELSPAQSALVTSILRKASIEYAHADGGALSSKQETAGPFTSTISVDTRSGRSALTRGQIIRLQNLEERLSGSGRRVSLVEVDPLANVVTRRTPSDLWAAL